MKKAAPHELPFFYQSPYKMGNSELIDHYLKTFS